jgi:hypothetical protein
MALFTSPTSNRIIGHYEVPLDHPGDRERGRIWRIIYRGGGKQVSLPQKFDLSKSGAPELINNSRTPSRCVCTR